MSELLVIRHRFAAGECSFMVLGETWFDGGDGSWKGRLVFLPLDGSRPRGAASTAVVRGVRRDAVVRRLGETTDRVLQKTIRAISPSAARAG